MRSGVGAFCVGSRLALRRFLLELCFLEVDLAGVVVAEPPGAGDELVCGADAEGAEKETPEACAEFAHVYAKNARTNDAAIGSFFISLRRNSLPSTLGARLISASVKLYFYYGDFPVSLKQGHRYRRVSSNQRLIWHGCAKPAKLLGCGHGSSQK